MKKLISIVGFVACTALVIYSCKKKLGDTAESSTAENGIGITAKSYPNVTYENGMIKFSSGDVFDAIYDQMVIDRKNQVITYPADDYYKDADPVLEDFEAKFPQHNSIRKQVKMAQRAEVDGQTETSNLILTRSWVNDPLLNTFMNSKNQFQIGQKIYYWKRYGIMLVVNDGNIGVLRALENTNNFNQFKNVELVNMSVGSFGNKMLNQFGNDDGNGTVDTCSKLKVTFSNAISHTAKTVTCNYTGSTWSGNTYSWDFGDGTAIVLGQSPGAHVYAAYGTYSVKLTVYNPGTMCTKTSIQTVKIGECAANFNSFAGQNGSYTFNAAPSNSSATITSYVWTFGDGTTITTTTPVTTHTFICDGDFAVSLTLVSSSCSGASSATVNTVTVSTYQCCQTNYNISGRWKTEPNYATDKRIEYNISQENTTKSNWFTSPKFIFHAELENWEYRKYGKILWKRWLKTDTDMEISVNGNVYGKNQNKCACDVPYSLNGGTGQINDRKRDHCVIVPLLNGNKLLMKQNNAYTVDYKINGNLVLSWNNNATFLCDQ